MNNNLLLLVNELNKLLIKGDYYGAIIVNESITNILDTYKDAC